MLQTYAIISTWLQYIMRMFDKNLMPVKLKKNIQHDLLLKL